VYNEHPTPPLALRALPLHLRLQHVLAEATKHVVLRGNDQPTASTDTGVEVPTSLSSLQVGSLPGFKLNARMIFWLCSFYLSWCLLFLLYHVWIFPSSAQKNEKIQRLCFIILFSFIMKKFQTIPPPRCPKQPHVEGGFSPCAGRDDMYMEIRAQMPCSGLSKWAPSEGMVPILLKKVGYISYRDHNVPSVSKPIPHKVHKIVVRYLKKLRKSPFYYHDLLHALSREDLCLWASVNIADQRIWYNVVNEICV
jgi:hypothetical protein